MTEQEKNVGLLAFVTKALVLASKVRGKAQLGDRSAYVGMSEMTAKCLRQTVGRKLSSSFDVQPGELDIFTPNGDERAIQERLTKLITLERGHAWEHMLEQGFVAGNVKFISQLEINYVHNNTPIKVHVDHTLVWPNGHVRVLESKCNEKIQSERLYAENELQLYGQIGFLKGLWNTASFGVKDENGNYIISRATFPQVVKHLFGFDISENPDEICLEGFLMSVTLNPNQSKQEAFASHGPYLPDNNMTKACLDRAELVWKTYQAVKSGQMSLDDVGFAYGFNPLCDFCDICDGCPKFKEVDREDLSDLMLDLYEKKQSMKRLKNEIDQIEASLQREYAKTVLAQTPFEDDDKLSYLRAGGLRFKATMIPGRESLNRNVLESELHALGLPAEQVEAVLAKATTTGKSYTRKYLSKIPGAKKKAA